MHLQILGGHQVESAEGRATAFLIDGTIAIDAGGLTGGLTMEQQAAVEAILLTHHHFDHISDLWPLVQPDVLVTEVTTPNARESIARVAGHLTPALLEAELVAFRDLKGYLPRVVVCHVNQLGEAAVRRELDAVAQRLQAGIEIAREGMLIDL